MSPTEIIRNLVRHSLEHTDHLTLKAKADLYEAAALVLQGDAAPDLIDTSDLTQTLGTLVNTLRPIAADAEQSTAPNTPDESTSTTETSSGSAARAAADSYARIGLFVGGGPSQRSEQARTNSLLSKFSDTVRREFRSTIDAIKESPRVGLGWA